GPRRHAQTDRSTRRAGNEGRGRFSAGRQNAAQGRSPGLPARVHFRDPRRQIPYRRSGAKGKDRVPPGLQIPVGLTNALTAPILRTEDLTVRFGGLTALNQVNFELAREEIRAVIGPNGAGKSTFFNCLTGVLRPSSGRILFDGGEITGLSSDRISHRGIA